MRRFARFVLLAALVSTTSVVFGGSASAKPYYKCHGNHCWHVFTPSAKFNVGYTDGLYNKTAGKAPLTCTTTTSITRTYKVEASVGGDVDFIFGSINASVSGSLQKSSTSGKSIKVGPVSVPAWTDEKCQRGMIVYRWKIKYCVGSSQGLNCHNIYASAPEGPRWRLTRTKIKH